MKLNYGAEATAKRLFASDAKYQCVRGPVGSGKSVMCTIKLLLLALRQEANPDKVRKSRWGIVRNTYPELKSTTIKTFQEWIPNSQCPIKYDSPISGMLKLPLPDGTRVEAEFLFLSLDRVEDAQKLLSLEFTGLWINEVQFLPPELVAEAYSRTGRYPSMKDGVEATWNGVIMDTNSPDTSHWYHNYEQKIKPKGWDFIIQPGALMEIGKIKRSSYTPWMKQCVIDEKRHVRIKDRLYIANPSAENLKNIKGGYGYWLNQIDETKDPGWIKSRLCNEYAMVKSGKPVYEHQFNQQLHISPDKYLANKKVPLALGFDFGRTPACAIGQLMPNGQLRILGEIMGDNIGIDQFLENVVKPHLKTHYPHHKIKDMLVFGDPAGVAGGDTTEKTCFNYLHEHGFEALPAALENNPTARWEAVRSYLTKLIGGGQPAFIMSNDVHTLAKGFMGGYAFQRMNVSGSEAVYAEKANKNMTSHIHDALQYLCQGLLGDVGEWRNENNAQSYKKVVSAAGY